MARMQWSRRDSVRPGGLMERIKHTEQDRGMETAGVERGAELNKTPRVLSETRPAEELTLNLVLPL